jgi:hypothetical protein
VPLPSWISFQSLGKVSLQYEELEPISRLEAGRVLAEGNEEEVGVALIRLALHDPDPQFVQAECLKFASDPRLWVRRNCATCFGHLARLHQRLDLSVVVPALLELAKDENVASWAESALDDIDIFMNPPKH